MKTRSCIQIALLLCVAACNNDIQPFMTPALDSGSGINTDNGDNPLLFSAPTASPLPDASPSPLHRQNIQQAACPFPLPFDEVVNELINGDPAAEVVYLTPASTNEVATLIGDEGFLGPYSLSFCVLAVMFGCQYDGTIVRSAAHINDSARPFLLAAQDMQDNKAEAFSVYFITGAPIIEGRHGSSLEIIMEEVVLGDYDVIGFEHAHVTEPDIHGINVYVTNREIFFVRQPDS